MKHVGVPLAQPRVKGPWEPTSSGDRVGRPDRSAQGAAVDRIDSLADRTGGGSRCLSPLPEAEAGLFSWLMSRRSAFDSVRRV